MSKFKIGQKVKVLNLHKDFPQLVPDDCDRGVIEATKTVYGIEIVLVALESGEIKKLPAIFCVPLQRDYRQS